MIPKHIVLIDDDRTTNLYHSIILEKAFTGIIINSFQDARIALDFLGSSDLHIDSICCDLQMPYMTGWEFVAQYEILLFKPRICIAPICIVSNSISDKDLLQINRFQALKACLEKPLDPALLQVALTD